MSVKSVIYNIYKRYQHFWPAATIANYVYTTWKSCGNSLEAPPGSTNYRVAFICDDMTWQCFSPECQAIFLTPNDWKDALRRFKPDMLFCESAWTGITERPDCWRTQIYKNKSIHRNNRKVLFEIVDRCKKEHCPTMFWNKEDPAFFENTTYNFVDTALHFDHIFTTAIECVPLYQNYGHQSVDLLPFGFSPSIFYPDINIIKENKAIFAGSWYSDQPQRCKDMQEIFDFVLAQGIELAIYDRQFASPNPVHRFPSKYEEWIRPAVFYSELGDIYRRSKYVVNINTVTSSQSMFARRVYEAIACDCVVISNYSEGLVQQFSEKIWFPGLHFDKSNCDTIAKENREEVFARHTYGQRLKQVLDVAYNDK